MEAASLGVSPAFESGAIPADKCENVFGAGAEWKGTLTVDTSVRLDGNFSGEIQSKATVHVAQGAVVDAKVRAAFVVIAGNFRGRIQCEQRVDLLPKSRVEGEVITQILSIEEGAIFDGQVQMTATTSAPLKSGQKAAVNTDPAERPDNTLEAMSATSNNSGEA